LTQNSTDQKQEVNQQSKVHPKPNKCNSEVLQRVNMHGVFVSQHFAEQFHQMSAPVLKTLKVMLAHAQQQHALNEKALNCFQAVPQVASLTKQ